MVGINLQTTTKYICISLQNPDEKAKHQLILITFLASFETAFIFILLSIHLSEKQQQHQQ